MPEVVYCVFGSEHFRRQCCQSIWSLRAVGYRGRIRVLTDLLEGWPPVHQIELVPLTQGSPLRAGKTLLPRHCSADVTLYLDADTLALEPIDGLFELPDEVSIAAALDDFSPLRRAIK